MCYAAFQLKIYMDIRTHYNFRCSQTHMTNIHQRYTGQTDGQHSLTLPAHHTTACTARVKKNYHQEIILHNFRLND